MSVSKMSLDGTNIGNVRIVRLLGEGGMGKVYLGLDEKLDRRVAVKVLSADRRLKTEAKARFLREARLLSQLDDPGICRIYDLIEGEDTDFLILEFIDGVTLTEAIKTATGESSVLHLFAGVARSLAAAHRQGIVHRDLKPDNVMVTRQGQVKVLDFGIARSVKAHVVAAEAPDRNDDLDLESLSAVAGGTEPSPKRTLAMDTTAIEAEISELAGASVQTLHTRVGSLLGTIHYMSPEQASGTTITEASDLYSLGVMMQELLTGNPAYGEAAGMNLLLKVYRAETVPIRGVEPEIASLISDLIRIDPAARPNAEETAARMEFILGGPLRARRRRLRIMVSAVVACALMVAAGVAVHARLQAGRRAELAQTFARQAEEISWRMRAEYLSPAHDVRSAINEVKQNMQQLELRMDEVGDLAGGPGHAALGRGCLALDDLDAARLHLEAAIETGFRSPEADFALGLTLGRQYNEGLNRARRISDPQQREQAVQQLHRELRDPALAFLETSLKSPTTFPAYVRGLIALYEERFEDALLEADDLAAAVPWFYEAKMLQGEVNFRWARAHPTEARDLDRERELMEDAGIAFAVAAENARSLPAARVQLCSTLTRLIENSMLAQDNRLGTGDIDRAFAICQEAIDLNPEIAPPLVLQSGLSVLRARLDATPGRNPAASFAAAVELADRAISIDPDLPFAHSMAGWVRFNLAFQSFFATGDDPTKELELALANFEAVKRLTPGDSKTDIYLGDIYSTGAIAVHAIGLDPEPWLDKGIEVLETARVKQSDNPSYGAVGLGDMLMLKGLCSSQRGRMGLSFLEKAREMVEIVTESSSYPDDFLQAAKVERVLGRIQLRAGIDPRATFEASAETAIEAQKLSPDYTPVQIVIGWAKYWLAERNLLIEGHPGREVKEAMTHFGQALAIEPEAFDAQHGLACAHLLTARFLIENDRGANTELAVARKAIGKAIELRPGFGELRHTLGWLEFLEGRLRAQTGRSPLPAWDAAEKAFHEAVETGFDDALSFRFLAEVHLWRGRWLGGRNAKELAGQESEEFEEGLVMVTRALEINPRSAEAEFTQGLLELERTRVLADTPRSNETRKRAHAAFQRAGELSDFMKSRPQKQAGDQCR